MRCRWLLLLAVGLLPTTCTDDGDPCGICGDGVVDIGEECDCGTDSYDLPAGCTQPNEHNGDSSCRSDCRLPYCGDGIWDRIMGEDCDDGNLNQHDACPSGVDATDPMRPGCRNAICGDGFIWDEDGGTEVCDDGNFQDDDACPSGPRGGCQAHAGCGDGIVFVGVEQCDCGLDPQSLPPGCDTINSDTLANASCRTDCTFVTCGDGVVDTDRNEECDDGAQNSDVTPDACRENCLLPWCGDGVQDATELCDCGLDLTSLPGGCAGINSDTNPLPCRASCVLNECGDGVVDPSAGEACDGSNFQGLTCQGLGFSGGSLVCDASCLIDLSGCVD